LEANVTQFLQSTISETKGKLDSFTERKQKQLASLEV
jgi:hypothetical protein